MSYIAALIALIMMASNSATGPAWTDLYFDTLVQVEGTFMRLSWIPSVVGIVVFLISYVVQKTEKSVSLGSFKIGCGCISVLFLLWPILQWITLLLARGMASSFTSDGLVNQGKFIICLVLYLVIGTAG